MPAETATNSVAPSSMESVIDAIVSHLDANIIGIGTLAMLRRIDFGVNCSLAEPALQRLLAAHVPDTWVDQDRGRLWALLIHSMALAAPSGIRCGAGLGEPLFAAGYKEGRLVRLLEADVETLGIVVPRAVRFLAAHAQPLDPVALGYFTQGIAAGRERAESQRTRVARDYYRAERAASH